METSSDIYFLQYFQESALKTNSVLVTIEKNILDAQEFMLLELGILEEINH